VDGRRLRSEVSRERIVSAMIALITEGDVTPSAEAVAGRAGVGLRTVFRHFENMETLYQEINAKVSAEIRPIMERGYQSEAWPDRLRELIDRRATIFERIMALKIAADVHRHHSAFLSAQTAETVREQRRSILEILPEAAAADPVLTEGLDLLLSFDTWRRLRKEQALSPETAGVVLEAMVRRFIAHSPLCPPP